MEERRFYAHCQQHCKEEVYSKDQVTEMLQEVESGNMGTLPWYKGTSGTIKYEYSGVDPAIVTMKVSPNLLSYIVSDSLDALEVNTDMASILRWCENGFFAKVYNSGYEYFAMFDTSNKKLIITKHNNYVKQISEEGEVTIQYLVYKNRDGDFKTHFEVVTANKTTAQGSNIIQIQNDIIQTNTFIEIFLLDQKTYDYVLENFKSVTFFSSGLVVINLKAGTIADATNLQFGVKVMPCQCNTTNSAMVMLCANHFSNM